ncbi:MAG: hypothetical protein L0Z53_21140 [Acidobacteriales bacterium]|nr:hypothetical protein [Terriglobales bacterium]
MDNRLRTYESPETDQVEIALINQKTERYKAKSAVKVARIEADSAERVANTNLETAKVKAGSDERIAWIKLVTVMVLLVGGAAFFGNGLVVSFKDEAQLPKKLEEASQQKINEHKKVERVTKELKQANIQLAWIPISPVQLTQSH